MNYFYFCFKYSENIGSRQIWSFNRTLRKKSNPPNPLFWSRLLAAFVPSSISVSTAKRNCIRITNSYFFLLKIHKYTCSLLYIYCTLCIIQTRASFNISAFLRFYVVDFYEKKAYMKFSFSIHTSVAFFYWHVKKLAYWCYWIELKMIKNFLVYICYIIFASRLTFAINWNKNGWRFYIWLYWNKTGY